MDVSPRSHSRTHLQVSDLQGEFSFALSHAQECPKGWTIPSTWSNYAIVGNGKLAQEWPGLKLAIHNHHHHQSHIVD